MGGKTSKSSQTITIPPEVMARYNAVNARAEQAANTPFQQYTGEFVAPLTATQRQGIGQTVAASNIAQPYYQAATGYQVGAQEQATPYYQAATDLTGQGLNVGQQYLGGATAYGLAGGQSVNPTALDAGAIQQYMSPYLQNVLQGTAGLLNQENQQAMSGQLGSAIRSGAFGGDRSGIAAANLRQQQQLANAKIYSDILNQGYGQALSTAQQQQALGLSAEQANRAALQSTADRLSALGQQGYGQYMGAGQQMAGLGQGIYGMGSQTAQGLAGLGAGAQAAALQGAQAVTAAGGLEQQTQQAEDTARYNQFLQEQSYPFQVAQFLANIAEGTGALSGSTTTTKQPGGFFSDRRLKENIEKVGKTYDGQNIYRYNYKGDSTPQIGLIAQEVEKHHPDAVTLDGKYRVVDYDKATDDAAERDHFYGGGLARAQNSAALSQYMSGMSPVARQSFSQAMYDAMTPADEVYKARAGLAGGGHDSMGGGVLPGDERQGFAMGGMPDVAYDPSGYTQLLQMYGSPMYQGLYGGAGGLAGGAGVGGIGIPSAPIQTGGLQVAGDLARQPSTFEQAGQIADTATSIRNLFSKKPPQGGQTPPKQEPPKREPDRVPQDDDDIVVYRADGGSAMPYAGGISGGLGIPNESNQRELMTAGDAPEKRKSGFKQVSDVAMKVLPMVLSDHRVKENIRDIGKTFDGQTVYSYNYKGDPRTQIGLIAQEVEKHHPQAVGLAGGMKTVNYKAATDKAAKRGKFAAGGMPEENPILAKIMREINPVSSWEDDLEPEVFSQFKPEEHRPVKAGLVAPAPAENGLMQQPKRPSPKLGLGAPAKMLESAKGETPSRFSPSGLGRGSRGLDQSIVSFFMNKGLSEGQARGIAAGIAAESGGNHEAINRESKAMGLGQWLGSRKQGILKQYGPNPSKEEQLEYLWGELQGGDPGGRHVLAQEDPHGVLHAYITKFMRPAKGYETESDLARGAAALREHRADGGEAGLERAFDTEFGIRPSALNEDEPSRIVPPISTGLSGYRANEALNRERQYASGERDEPFLRRLGAGKTDAVLSALTGLAAMGTAPTRSLGVALASGLGAGAQAYQGQREFERHKRETGIRGYVAQTQRMGLGPQMTQATASMLSAQGNNIGALKDWYNVLRQNQIIMESAGNTNTQEYAALREAMDSVQNRIRDLATTLAAGGLGGGAAAGAMPAVPSSGLSAGTPAAQRTPLIGKIDLKNPASMARTANALGIAGLPLGVYPELISAALEGGKVVGEGGIQPTPGAIPTTQTFQSAENAQQALNSMQTFAMSNAPAALMRLGELQHYASETPDKFRGQAGPMLAQWGNFVNQLASWAGRGPVFDRSAIANMEATGKVSGNLAQAAAEALSGRPGSEVLSAVAQTTPDITQSPEGFAKVLAATRSAVAANTTQYAFYEDYKRKHPNDWWVNVAEEYNKAYPPEYWATRANMDSAIMRNPELIRTIKERGIANVRIGRGEKLIDGLIRQYGQNAPQMLAEIIRDMPK